MDLGDALSSTGRGAGLATGRLLVRRARRQTALLAAVAGVVIAVTAVAIAVPALVEQGMRDGATQILSAQAPAGRAVRVTSGADGSPGSDARGTRALDDLFSPGTVDVTASSRTSDVPVLAGPAKATDSGLRVVLGSEADLSGIDVTAGSRGSVDRSSRTARGTPIPTAIQQDAASRLGLAVGDRIVVGTTGSSVELRVAAIWRARDPLAARWFGDPLVGSGEDSGDVGPLLVSAVDLPRLDDVADVQRSWTVAARASSVAPGAVATLRSGLARVADALPARGVTPSDDTDEAGSLDGTAQSVEAADAVTRAVLTVALALVGAAGIVSIVQLSSLLAAARRSEAELLRARGGTSRQLVAAAAIETLALALPSAVVGLALGAVAARVIDPGWFGSDTLLRLVVSVGAAALGAPILAGLVHWRQGPRVAERGWALVIATLAVALAAAFGVWRLSRSGLPTDGSDLPATLSPVLVVVAGSLGSVLLVGAVASIAARVLARTRRPGAVLVARQLARRRGAFAGAVVALALVTAGAGFATSLARTSADVDAAAARISLGGVSRVAGSGDLVAQAGTQAVTSAPIAALPGVTRAVTVLDDAATVGQQSVAVVGLPATRAEHLLGDDGDVRSLAGALDPGRLAGVELPRGSRTLDARITAGAAALSGAVSAAPAGGGPGSLSVVAWLADSDGAVVALPLRTRSGGGSATAGDPVPLGSSARATAALPAASGRWRLVALEPALQLQTSDGETATARLEVSEVQAGASASALSPVAVTLSTSIDTESVPGRLPITAAGPPRHATAATRLPVVVTRSLADQLGVATGSHLDLSLASTGGTVPARIATIVETIPGSDSADAVAVDLPTLIDDAVLSGAVVPRPLDVWARDDGDGLAREVAAVLPYPAQTTTPAATSASPVVGSGVDGLLVAVILAAVLSAVVVAACATGLALGRRDEGAALRALGIPPRRHGLQRFAELVAAVVGGLVGGLATGIAASLLTAAHVGIAASPGAASLIVVDASTAPARWAVIVGATAGAAVVLAAAAGARAGRDAVTAAITGADR